ncbi:hypothetical protein TNCV_2206811 [Trichonephila clavipes]|uniref:Uncharacterized protein n=1 Tax=Trichonephila clavipes TaxID=2585209 RepID=A0A8X6S5X3_TRICX|nr:hypothetical protein TNCV_2206811 [Trichonephila clavipes]
MTVSDAHENHHGKGLSLAAALKTMQVKDSCPTCYEFDPSINEALNLSRFKRSPVGVVWKFGEEDVSSGVALVT